MNPGGHWFMLETKKRSAACAVRVSCCYINAPIYCEGISGLLELLECNCHPSSSNIGCVECANRTKLGGSSQACRVCQIVCAYSTLPTQLEGGQGGQQVSPLQQQSSTYSPRPCGTFTGVLLFLASPVRTGPP